MARALSLSAYLAFARREPAVGTNYAIPRPSGALVWMHCSDPARARTLVQLGARMIGQRTGLSLVMTVPAGANLPVDLDPAVLIQEVPSEHPSDVAAFLDHWKPSIGLWLGPWLRPSLIHEAARRGISMCLLDADEPRLENRKFRLLPEPVRATLRLFDTIFARTAVTASRLRRQAPDVTSVVESGTLLEESAALPFSESDLEDVTSALAGRPVWLAAHVQREELDAVLSAHRATIRLSHRLLLVLVPGKPELEMPFRERLAETEWRVAHWDDGEMPDANVQILLAGDKSELGLWYRVAPLTFVGSSLVAGYGGRNPMQPAALGSALLYGPGVRHHLESYTRLARAGAARIVRDSASLSAALGLMTAPDQVAAMAQAGWATVTEGAETSDQIITHVLDVLDAKGL